MVKDKLYLGSIGFDEDKCTVKVYATLDDPDFKGSAMGVALEFHLARETNDLTALERVMHFSTCSYFPKQNSALARFSYVPEI